VESDRDPASFAAVAAIVPGLLVCGAVYSLADALNATFSFAFRGAGDTRSVSLLTSAVVWFTTACIVAMAVCFRLRFRCGSWTMRVVELAPTE
jgi:multidrug resistance protein, MATE family